MILRLLSTRHILTLDLVSFIVGVAIITYTLALGHQAFRKIDVQQVGVDLDLSLVQVGQKVLFIFIGLHLVVQGHLLLELLDLLSMQVSLICLLYHHFLIVRHETD